MLDEVGFRLDHARDEHLPIRQLDLLEQRPFVRVTRVGRLDRDRRGPRAEHDVDHVGERDVAVMRAFVVAPTEMHTQPLGRDVRHRVIERLDVQLRLHAPFREVQVRVLNVPPHAKVGAVDLQHDAGAGDGLVLVPHRVGDGKDVRFLTRVMLVAEKQRHDAGRRRGQEHLLGLHVVKRGLQMVDIRLRRLRIAHTDSRVARRRLSARAAGIAEDAFGEIGEGDQILIDEGVPGTAEPGQPILDVRRVARLAHLAVVDHVDAGFGLLAHDLLDSGCDALGKRSRVDRHALFPGVHHPDQVLRPGQATGVRGEKPLGAALHAADSNWGQRTAWRYLSPAGATAISVETDKFHPVGALSGGVLVEELERAAGLVDRIDGNRLRLFSGRDEELAFGIDGESARLTLGGRAR